MRVPFVAASLLLAGLLGLPGCLEGEVGLLTAKDARSDADDAAEDWQEDAALVSAFGMEAGREAREEMASLLGGRDEPGSEGQIPDEERAMLAAVAGAEDDIPGDGKAPLWVFSYVSEDAEATIEVGVTGEGVVFTHEGDGGGEDEGFGLFGSRPVSGWRIDSDDGADVAREDSGFEQAVQDPGVLAMTFLVQGEEAPIWLFGAGSSDGDSDDDESFVAVDAATGEAIDAEDVLRQLIGFTLREAGSASGTLNAPNDRFETSFDIQMEGHGVLAVLVAVTPGALMPMPVTVTDPAGNSYEGQVDQGVGFETTGTVMVTPVLTGEYTVTVSADLAAFHDWEISYCTDGEAFAPFGSRACDVVGTGQSVAPSLATSFAASFADLVFPAWVHL
jgi:hypothetical protein